MADEDYVSYTIGCQMISILLSLAIIKVGDSSPKYHSASGSSCAVLLGYETLVGTPSCCVAGLEEVGVVLSGRWTPQL